MKINNRNSMVLLVILTVTLLAGFAVLEIVQPNVAQADGFDVPLSTSTIVASDVITNTTPLAATRTITDFRGRVLELPVMPQRIGAGWTAHNTIIALLGAFDRVVGTESHYTPENQPWFYKIFPQLYDTPKLFGPDVNPEEVLKLKPDIVFLPWTDVTTDKLIEVGLPVMVMGFWNFDMMKDCVRLSGEVLGGDAPQRAEAYLSYLDSKIAMLDQVTAQIPESERVRVLHLSGMNPIIADGRNCIMDEWIKIAGGVNVAALDLDGHQKEVSFEQVLTWDPDVIIINVTKGIDQALQDPNWQQLKAVRTGKVYVAPSGLFRWDRYGTEEAMNIQWVATKLYPDKFTDLDIVEETKSFYKTFYNYELTDDEVQDILNPPLP